MAHQRNSSILSPTGNPKNRTQLGDEKAAVRPDVPLETIEDGVPVMDLSTLYKGLSQTNASAPLLRVMVFGLDVELRNTYIQHWIDVKKTSQWMIRDLSERYMRFYSHSETLANGEQIFLELFDMMKPWKMTSLPPTDMNVIVLPFTQDKDKAQRQRIEKYLRSIRELIEFGQKDSFLTRMIVLLEHNYHMQFRTMPEQTFLRMRTKVLKDMRDLFTTVLGTIFASTKKINHVYLFERDKENMVLKDDLDCRFPICNHMVRHGLKSMTRRDVYVTWLLKRNIPLPKLYAEKVLEYCQENKGLKEKEKDQIWKNLASRRLLPIWWDEKGQDGFAMEVKRMEMPLLLRPALDMAEFKDEIIRTGVDPVEHKFEMVKTSTGVEPIVHTFESSKMVVEQEKDVTFGFGSEKISVSKDEEDKSSKFENQTISLSQEKKMDEGFSSATLSMSQDQEDKASQFASASLSVSVDSEDKSMQFASSKVSVGQELEDKSMQFASSKVSEGQELEDKSTNFEAANVSINQEDENSKKTYEFTSEQISLEQEHQLSPRPVPKGTDGDEDYLEMDAFFIASKLPDRFKQLLIDEGYTHPQQLVELKKTGRTKLAQKIGLKGQNFTKFMQTLEKLEKGPHKSKKFYNDYNKAIAQLRSERQAMSPKLGGISVETLNKENEDEEDEDEEQEQEDLSKKPIPQTEDWASQFEQASDSIIKETGTSKIFAFGRRMSQELKKLMKKKEVDLDQLLAMNRSKRPVLQNTFPGTYVGGPVEQKAFDVLTQRLQTTDQIESEIRLSLQRLDTSTLKTREEIEKTFDELIEMLKQRKKEALEQCDQFADKTRKDLIETAINVDNTRNTLMQAHNLGKQILHVQNSQTEGYPARVKFQEFMMKILVETALNITIPSVEMDVFWDKQSLEWIRGVLANVQTNTIDKTRYLDDKAYGASPSPQPSIQQQPSPQPYGSSSSQQHIYLQSQPQPTTPNVIVVNPNGTQTQPQLPEWWNLFMSATGSQLLSPKQSVPLTMDMGSEASYVGSEDGKTKQNKLGVDNMPSLSLESEEKKDGASEIGSVEEDIDEEEDDLTKNIKTISWIIEKEAQGLDDDLSKPTIGSMQWVQNWEHNNKFCKFPRKNEVNASGSCFCIIDVNFKRSEVTTEPFRFQIECLEGNSSGWFGFCRGPLNEVAWYKGDAAPEDSFGVFSDHGLWYVGMDHKGTGLRGSFEKGMRVDLEIQWDVRYGEWRVKGRTSRKDKYRDLGHTYVKEHETVCFGIVNTTSNANYAVWTEKEAERELKRREYLRNQILYGQS